MMPSAPRKPGTAPKSEAPPAAPLMVPTSPAVLQWNPNGIISPPVSLTESVEDALPAEDPGLFPLCPTAAPGQDSATTLL
ncbi:hypothetical protein QR680_019317 [Steinernema hermaphroditum]|uniref:Uncharacterized protein n=1 Tax=Steinernema hermaphroditum TaxID=289476 RepID=A0AA39GPU9_9BILA|nr:hypothetical protein QR680_019317 [Steinernema hermaphroditum]